MEFPSIFPQTLQALAEEDLRAGRDTGQCHPAQAPPAAFSHGQHCSPRGKGKKGQHGLLRLVGSPTTSLAFYSLLYVSKGSAKKKEKVHYRSNPVRTENNKVVLLFGFVCELFSSAKTGQASPASLQGTWTHGREPRCV